mmetsp:Transcript_50152/g.150974  ORF Transcript_50152/g.150974 Transcript_50152/m.150974 type:complete len:99 (+) Transcript_50152:444-740(+)
MERERPSNPTAGTAALTAGTAQQEQDGQSAPTARASDPTSESGKHKMDCKSDLIAGAGQQKQKHHQQQHQKQRRERPSAPTEGVGAATVIAGLGQKER